MNSRIPVKLCRLSGLALVVFLGCKQEPAPTPPPEPPPSPEAPSCEPLDRSAQSPALPGFCEGDWCWVNPLPQGFSLMGVWSPAPDVAWAVGQGGAIVRAEAGRAVGVQSPTDEQLNDVWGRSDSDIWAVGNQGTTLHFDGQAWAVVPTSTTAHLSAVSGTPAGGVWAAGSGGTLLYWNGQAWGSVPTGTTEDLADVWAAGPQEAWVAGKAGALRCLSSGCTSVPPPGAGFSPMRVQGLGPEDVYFLQGTVIHHWAQGVWSTLAAPGYQQTFDLRVNAPDDIWVSAFNRCLGCIDIHNFLTRWDGARWSSYFDGGAYGYFPWYALWSTGPDDLWAVGRGGRLHRRKGTSEQELLGGSPLRFRYDYEPRTFTASPALASIAELPASADGTRPLSAAVAGAGERLWVGGPEDVWTVTAAHQGPFRGISTDRLDVYYRGSLFFQTASRPASWDLLPVGVHGSSTRNVWFTDIGGVYRWNGSRIDRMLELTPPDRTAPDYTGPVWALAEDDVWFGGKNGLHHWDGTSFDSVVWPGVSVAGLWGSWQQDLWAVGARDGKPVSFHWDGSAWSEVPLPAGSEVAGGLVHVTGRCPGEVYAIGSKRAVFRWTGEAWELIPVPIALGSFTSGARVGNELWLTGTLPDAGWGPFIDNTPVVLRTPWRER